MRIELTKNEMNNLFIEIDKLGLKNHYDYVYTFFSNFIKSQGIKITSEIEKIITDESENLAGLFDDAIGDWEESLEYEKQYS